MKAVSTSLFSTQFVFRLNLRSNPLFKRKVEGKAANIRCGGGFARLETAIILRNLVSTFICFDLLLASLPE